MTTDMTWLTAVSTLLAVLLVTAIVWGLAVLLQSQRKLAEDVEELRELRNMPPDASARDITRIGRYRVLRKLGSGGMARVYLARGGDGKFVALKIPDPHLFETEEHRTYFSQELSVGKKMQHPNVVRILDYSDGGPGRIPYIAMEFVDGVTLDKKLPTKKPIKLHQAAFILHKIISGLEYAHNMGVVHRDIKPENVMISRTGDIKVADFGIARDIWDPPRVNPDENTFVGSPHYMSPEQINSEKIDYRTDYYAFGVLAFRMLTGHLPFEGENTLEIITRKVSQLPPPPSAYNQEIPLELESLVRDLLQREPDRRPVSATGIRKVLRKYLPAVKRRRSAPKRPQEEREREDF